MTRFFRGLYVPLFALVLVAQAPQRTPSADYRIGIGDVLDITVWGEPQLTRHLVVQPDGKITLPLIAEVATDGLSVREAQASIAAKLTRYVRAPQVTVAVTEIHSKFIYVTGEVLRPGAYPLLAPTNVMQLVARAGGATAFAKTKRAYVLRKSDGARIPIDYKAVLQGRKPEQNLDIAAGDTVVIP